MSPEKDARKRDEVNPAPTSEATQANGPAEGAGKKELSDEQLRSVAGGMWHHFPGRPQAGGA